MCKHAITHTYIRKQTLSTENTMCGFSRLSGFIYIYMYMFVCVCECVRVEGGVHLCHSRRQHDLPFSLAGKCVGMCLKNRGALWRRWACVYSRTWAGVCGGAKRVDSNWWVRGNSLHFLGWLVTVSWSLERIQFLNQRDNEKVGFSKRRWDGCATLFVKSKTIS